MKIIRELIAWPFGLMAEALFLTAILVGGLAMLIEGCLDSELAR